MRKPRPVSKGNKTLPIWEADITTSLWVDVDVHGFLDPHEAKRLAAWLLKAAAWIREQETKR